MRCSRTMDAAHPGQRGANGTGEACVRWAHDHPEHAAGKVAENGRAKGDKMTHSQGHDSDGNQLARVRLCVSEPGRSANLIADLRHDHNELRLVLGELLEWCVGWMPDEAKDQGARSVMARAHRVLRETDR